MKIREYEIAEGLPYTKEHEWVRFITESEVIIGISDYAAKLLHEVVYASLPNIGAQVMQMESFGTVESVKAVSDLFAPLSGKVIEINDSLENQPELVTQSPYHDGWLIKLEVKNVKEEMKSIMDHNGYAKLIERSK